MQVLLPLAITAAVLVAVGIWLLVKMPKRKQARMLVEPGKPLELRCAPADDRAYKIWVRYKVAYTGSEGKGKESFGLLFELKVTAGEQTFMDQSVAFGGGCEQAQAIIVPDEFFAGLSRDHSGYVRWGTFVLAEAGPRDHGSEILVNGTIHADRGTTVNALEVFVAA